jgi:hypothetical protein
MAGPSTVATPFLSDVVDQCDPTLTLLVPHRARARCLPAASSSWAGHAASAPRPEVLVAACFRSAPVARHPRLCQAGVEGEAERGPQAHRNPRTTAPVARSPCAPPRLGDQQDGQWTTEADPTPTRPRRVHPQHGAHGAGCHPCPSAGQGPPSRSRGTQRHPASDLTAPLVDTSDQHQAPLAPETGRRMPTVQATAAAPRGLDSWA